MTGETLLLGATGTVGGALLSALNAQGVRPRLLIRDTVKGSRLARYGEVVVADLMKYRTLAPAFQGVRRVFVVAPPGPAMEEMEANAFTAAWEAGAEGIVYISNFGAERFEDELFQAHGRNEARLQSSGMNWTIIRPTRFMSNAPYDWAGVRQAGRLLEPIGRHPVVLVDPRDVADLAAAALSGQAHFGMTYELMSEALTGDAMAAIIGRKLGRHVEFNEPTEESAWAGLLDSGIPDSLARTILYYFQTVREGRWHEVATLRALIGKEPRSYASWIDEHVVQMT